VIGTLSLVIIIFIFLHLIHNTSLFTCPFMMCHRG
jgi:hypothetical protein